MADTETREVSDLGPEGGDGMEVSGRSGGPDDATGVLQALLGGLGL